MLISKRAGVKSDTPAYKEKEKSESGGIIYRYDESHIKKRQKLKSDKLKKLEKEIEKVRKHYTKDLTSDDEKTRAIAAVVGLMDHTAVRIGNEDSAKEGTFGATTLKVKHVKGGSGNMTFDFPGKGLIEQNIVLKNDKVIKVIRDLMKGKKPNDFIFEVDGKKIWDRTINRYLSPLGISAKDLRGFRANKLMQDMLKKKDFAVALEEVAEIVGHEAATLKNQYLDPELVEKHEGKEKDKKEKEKNKGKKKAAISSRALEVGSPGPQEIPEPKDIGTTVKQISQERPDYWTPKPNPSYKAEQPVDLTRNVQNIHRSARVTPMLGAAWKILAPFLPVGARFRNANRTWRDQKIIIRNYWTSKRWRTVGKSRSQYRVAPGEGFFYTMFPNVAKIDALVNIDNVSEGELKKALTFMTKEYSSKEIVMFAGKERPVWQANGPWNTLKIAWNTSKHIGGNAIDIDGAPLNKISEAVSYVMGDPNMSQYISISGMINEADQGNLHVSINNALSVPKETHEESVRKYFGLLQPAQGSGEYALSKRAKLSPEDSSWVNSLKSQPMYSQQGSDSLKKDLRIRKGVKLNQLILDAWKTLRVFLPRSAVMTSGFRTADDQKRILSNYWKKATGKDIPEHLKSDERVWIQVSVLLGKHHGYIVGPPTTKREYAHLKGNSFDVSGADLYEIAAAVRKVSKDSRLPVKFRSPLVEDKNNAVHIGVESAVYDENAIAQVASGISSRTASISKLAKEEVSIEDIYYDLLESNPPEEVIKEFETIHNVASFDYEDFADDCFVDDEEDMDPDMGFGKEDGLGDWFEKSPILRHREDVPDHEIHNISDPEAKALIKEDPEKFFYRGLHKENPELEAEALKQLIKTNAKFFFIFRYHEREEEDFKNLVEKAAELLSQQDVRAFFYYNLHHKFPELGRGAIVQLIDTNPDSFHEFGLGKDYPDLEESAAAARNIKDPQKVELEQPEWMKGEKGGPISIRDKNASNHLSKRSEEQNIVLTEEEKKVLEVFDNTVKKFKLRTTVRIAGGWVRDKVMGRESKDIDVAVDNMMGKEFASYVKQYAQVNGIKATVGLIPAKPEQGKNLETAVIHMFDQEIEVVNLRDEEYDEKSRRPVTTITNSPVKDAFRRDLTINSLFYNVSTGEVEDFTGDGINDIREGIIRTPTTSPENEEEVGREITPKAIFMDDPLRVLRAIRFANRYGFKIQDDLAEAAKDPEVQEAFRKKITWERRQDELRKIMSENKSPRYALNIIKDWGYRAELLQLPDDYSEWDLDQNNPNHELNIWNHLMESLDNLYTITKDMDIDKADRYVLNWAALLHDIGKLDPKIIGTKQVGDQIRNTFHKHEQESVRAAEYLLKKLKGTKTEEIKRIQTLIDAASKMNPQHADPTEQTEMSNKSIGKILQITKDFEQDWQRAMELAIADSAAHKEGWLPEYPMNYWESLRDKFTAMPKGTATMGPVLDGNELMQLFGRKGGQWLGTLNKAMVEWQMENPMATKDQAAEFAKQHYEQLGLDKSANAISKRTGLENSLISRRAKKDKPKAGIFIKLPRDLAKQFPSLEGHDDSVPHVTALFIGAVSEAQEILLEEIVKRVAMEHDSFEMSLDNKVSYFPATKHSDDCKVAKINIISPYLKKLHKALKKAITGAEMSVDDHFPDYKPHTTLEYMPPPKEKYDTDIPKGSWTADKIEIWNGDKKTTIPLGTKKSAGSPISIRDINKNAGEVAHLTGIPKDIEDELGDLPGGVFPRDQKFSPADTISGGMYIGDIGDFTWSFFNKLSGHLGKRERGYAATANLRLGDFDYVTVFRTDDNNPYEVLNKLKEFMNDGLYQKMSFVALEKQKEEDAKLADVVPLFGEEKMKSMLAGAKKNIRIS